MFNRAILMGRLCDDPKFSQTQNSIACCRFRIAVNRPKSKDGNQEADFINIETWRSTAEFVSRYFTKGKMILVEGQIRNNNYTDSNGVKRYEVKVLADSVSFCGEKQDAGAAPEQQTYQAQPNAGQQQYYAQQGQPYPYSQQGQYPPPPPYGAVPPPQSGPYPPR